MDDQTTTTDKKSFLRDDRRLVCSMLVFYGICILGLIAATLIGLDRRNRRLSAEATSTAVAIATHQANITATARAHAKELEEYEFIERFDMNDNHWMVGPQNNEYWIGTTALEDGVYLWDVLEVKKAFIYWADFSRDRVLTDFDVYVDFKILEGKQSQVCSGLIFRRSSKGWDHGGYSFMVCNSAFFQVSYHEKDWESVSDWIYSPGIQPSGWNRIEVSARGDHFTFGINNEVVFDMTDDRRKVGDIALLVQVSDQSPAKVSFDNFGLQNR